MQNVETEAEGIVQPRRCVGDFIVEVNRRLDMDILSRYEPERNIKPYGSGGEGRGGFERIG